LFRATIRGEIKITIGSLGGKKRKFKKGWEGVKTDGKVIKSDGNRVGETGREGMKRGRKKKRPWVKGEPRRFG